jgi:hypothetical protein
MRPQRRQDGGFVPAPQASRPRPVFLDYGFLN